MNEISIIQNAGSTLLNADRDAYQSFITEFQAMNTLDMDELTEIDKTHIENIQQVWDRVIGSGANLDESMTGTLNLFQEEFALWKTHSDKVIELSIKTANDYSQINLLTVKTAIDFSEMRNLIDIAGEAIHSALNQTLSPARRRELENAQSLILNGDRDAYQAEVSQLQVLNKNNYNNFAELRNSNVENSQQTFDRVTEAMNILNSEDAGIFEEFTGKYALWNESSILIFRILNSIIGDLQTIESEQRNSSESFGVMRNLIDLMVGNFDENIVLKEQETADEIRYYIILYSITLIFSLLISILFVFFMSNSLINKQLGKDPSEIMALVACVSRGDLSIDTEDTRASGIYKSILSMVKALRLKVEMVEKFADGDFSIAVTPETEKDTLGVALEIMKWSLNDLLTSVAQAGEQVSSGADQIASSSQDVSHGASEQASSLEEIASTLNEINELSSRNSAMAIESSNLAKDATDSAESGNSQMIKLVSAMANINNSADEIKKVVKIIDDIAFQINLLALNANVEAARAGKYGKGFAVVADEVRNLAIRSGDAVKETTGMVEVAISNIKAGNQLAESTAEQLQNIVSGAQKVSEILEDITSGSREQTLGINQVTEALDQINNVTQSNVSNAEQSSASSEELSGQADLLINMIRHFTLDRHNKRDVHLEEDSLLISEPRPIRPYT